MFSSCRKPSPPPVAYNNTENQEKVSFLPRHNHFSPSNNYPPLPPRQEPTSTSNTPNWQLTIGKFKNHEITTTVIENNIPTLYFFHPISQKITDSQNTQMFHLNHPDASLINQFYHLLGESHQSKGLVTPTGMIQNADHATLFYNSQEKSWHDMANNNLEISGIKPPLID